MTTELVIEADRVERQYWRDLWRYRELFYFLSWRDLLVRYKQTVVGVSWAVIRPLLTMLILTFVFGRLGRLPSGGVPYPLLVFCGMLPWQFFSTAMTESGGSLVTNGNLISKVYFPRLVIVVSSVMTSFVDFLVSAVFLAGILAWYHRMPPINLLALPMLAVLVFGISVGAGMWLAALTVEYRDFKHIVPFVVQLGLYVSPVGYLSGIVPAYLQLLFSLNPMVGIVDGFRWSILGISSATLPLSLILAVVEIAALLASGLWYFRRTERTFADVI